MSNPFALLTGTYKGTGLNVIWRPNDASAPGDPNRGDHFLALNLTSETLQFEPLGSVPNRGLGDPDISMPVVQYIQEIRDANFKATATGVKTHDSSLAPADPPTGINPHGMQVLHHEPGLWISVPDVPGDSPNPTVNRLGSIPHGVTIFAEGLASEVALVSGSFSFPPVSIKPSGGAFPEQTLITVPQKVSRTYPLPVGSAGNDAALQQVPDIDVVKGGIVQSMLDNPNSILKNELDALIAGGNTLESVTQLHVSTTTSTDNHIGSTGDLPTLTAQISAQVTGVDITFWLETWKSGATTKNRIQYSQTVDLLFNGITWPHVTVGNLTQQ